MFNVSPPVLFVALRKHTGEEIKSRDEPRLRTFAHSWMHPDAVLVCLGEHVGTNIEKEYGPHNMFENSLL